MTHGSHYLGKLYNDLIANSPQTISIDIPSDMGKGRIAQTQIKHGIIFSDWQMCYQSDMNVQGTVSKDYMQIMEFIEKLPQGIHSMAGDAGKMLSGGQRQRISLARAILKDAPIVVLDEATAYADPENEEKMEAAIAELVKGKTLVVIAHKLPAIMNADQICVIDHGKLVAAGKHQDLIRSCPEYQKLWKAAQDSAEWKVHTAKEGA